jgi:hypothetical protein
MGLRLGKLKLTKKEREAIDSGRRQVTSFLLRSGWRRDSGAEKSHEMGAIRIPFR